MVRTLARASRGEYRVVLAAELGINTRQPWPEMVPKLRPIRRATVRLVACKRMNHHVYPVNH